MARLIVHIEKDDDPKALTPHYRATASVAGRLVDGGWWRTEAKAVVRLVENVAAEIVAPTVFVVNEPPPAIVSPPDAAPVVPERLEK